MHLILTPHPDSAPTKPLEVWATVDHAAAFGATATINIWFGVGAPAGRFVIPELTEPWRADELWQTTCFEAFLRPRWRDLVPRVEFRAVGQLGGL